MVAKRTQMLWPTMLRYVALKLCHRLAGACKNWANSAAICCVELLRTFGRGFRGEKKNRATPTKLDLGASQGFFSKPPSTLYGSTPPGACHWMLVFFYNNPDDQKIISEDSITKKSDML